MFLDFQFIGHIRTMTGHRNNVTWIMTSYRLQNFSNKLNYAQVMR